MAIVINGSGTVTGLAVGGLPDSIVDADTLASSVNIIKQADVWRMTSHTGNVGSTATTVANWERMDDASFDKIGTGVSESSGLFSFPVTGIYEVTFYGICQARDGAVTQGIVQLESTRNNGSAYDTFGSGEFSALVNNVNMVAIQVLFDITDVSNHKFRIRISTGANSIRLLGDTDYNRTSLRIIRLGDT